MLRFPLLTLQCHTHRDTDILQGFKSPDKYYLRAQYAKQRTKCPCTHSIHAVHLAGDLQKEPPALQEHGVKHSQGRKGFLNRLPSGKTKTHNGSSHRQLLGLRRRWERTSPHTFCIPDHTHRSPTCFVVGIQTQSGKCSRDSVTKWKCRYTTIKSGMN